MIVIADDLTGAAEIAGICLRFGLRIHFTFDVPSQALPFDAEICIVSTDTRSMPLENAVEYTRNLCGKLKLYGFGAIYKKTDSVLRGHVFAELKTMQQELGYSSVLCIPVNPPNGRIIKDEIFYIEKRPLHETSFSQDPDFPARSSRVKELLKSDDESIYTGDFETIRVSDGFMLPDISGDDNLPTFLSFLSNPKILPAGGGYFFNAWLLHKGYKVIDPLPKKPVNNGKWLMVCGSTHLDSKIFIKKMRNEGVQVIEMNEVFSELTHTENHDENFWMQRALKALDIDQKLILTVTSDTALSKDSPEYLKARLAQRVKTLLDNTKVEHLYIEGGATAQAAAKILGINEMIPVSEWQQGVVQMKTRLESPVYFTLKPGSYKWPESLF
ncbi:MAG: four-carbon acid sugar kinase family protein [Cyclobacteriaceae bacterium]|nr:four-carbon acid sugar kinase family protein [Cyclobacteriaceae bacterium]